MPTQPHEMLAAAKALSGLEGEMFRRAAVHQAYYSVYHLACDALGLDPANNYGGARHKEVVEAVEKAKPGSSRMHRMKKHMRKLKRLRGVADYELATTLTEVQVKNAVAMAEDIFRAPL